MEPQYSKSSRFFQILRKLKEISKNDSPKSIKQDKIGFQKSYSTIKSNYDFWRKKLTNRAHQNKTSIGSQSSESKIFKND